MNNPKAYVERFNPRRPRPTPLRITDGVVPDAFDYVGYVDRVKDGDTVAVTLTRTVDMGFGNRSTVYHADTIRLAGMDAQPLKTEAGDRAAEWLKARTGAGTGRVLHVVTVKNGMGVDQREKYGRYLAYLFLTNDRTGETLYPSLNEEMIDVGLAFPWDGKGPHPGTLTSAPAPPPKK
jgi:endonuclease YncB( thermonuclease family)